MIKVCSSGNNNNVKLYNITIQVLLMLSCLIDLTNCYRCVLMLIIYCSIYCSLSIAMDNDRKLKFSSYVHLPSLSKMFQYRYA